eukprot:365105-Chlamydomonas_euryale.AAC.9
MRSWPVLLSICRYSRSPSLTNPPGEKGVIRAWSTNLGLCPRAPSPGVRLTFQCLRPTLHTSTAPHTCCTFVSSAQQASVFPPSLPHTSTASTPASAYLPSGHTCRRAAPSSRGCMGPLLPTAPHTSTPASACPPSDLACWRAAPSSR